MCMSLSGMKSAGGRGGAAWDGATCTCTCAVCSESDASASASEGGGEKVKGGKDGRGLSVIGMAPKSKRRLGPGTKGSNQTTWVVVLPSATGTMKMLTLVRGV